MAKSDRHKKLRRQEKAKTQLTGVRKLSKAKNVVEPTLRVKKILIREQLKTTLHGFERGLLSSGAAHSSLQQDDQEELTTRRKQTIPDLLASVNHHNVNIRKDAVVGLQEIASSQVDGIIRHLDKVLAKIAGLTSDKEDQVRKENLKLAEMVFSKVSENKLRPFWNMLIVHLKCTLTHLIPSVRHGALKFIELLVEYHPVLVTEASSVILPSVLSLISTTQSDLGDSSSKKNANTVTRLKVEISGKHVDVTERIKVLRLLSKCLSMTSMNARNSAKTGSSITNVVEPSEYLQLKYPYGYCLDQVREDELSKETGRRFSSGSFFSHFYGNITADPFTSAFTSDVGQQMSSFWHDFVISCVSVLIETWVELGPSLQQSEDSYVGNKGSKKKLKQSNFMQTGNDKNATNNSSNFGRQNGFHILNENTVDKLLCIVTLFDQLLQSNEISSNFSATGNYGSSNHEVEQKTFQSVRKGQGQNIMKYFFHLLPYVALQDSRRKDVVTVNLKLFLIAGKLKMFDVNLRKKLKDFVKSVLKWSVIDRDHCSCILSVISFLEDSEKNSLSTAFLIFVTNMGHFDIVADYLRSRIHPAYQVGQTGSAGETALNLQWSEVVVNLIKRWDASSCTVTNLFEVLSYVALRNLTDMHLVLTTCISELKELINASNSDVWDGAYRTFFYSHAETVLKEEFSTLYQTHWQKLPVCQVLS